ncbi:MAG TPA: SMP-30/gluconolactonase/LRE family protein [Nannocystis sp.]|jgi:gluconolactonase
MSSREIWLASLLLTACGGSPSDTTGTTGTEATGATSTGVETTGTGEPTTTTTMTTPDTTTDTPTGPSTTDTTTDTTGGSTTGGTTGSTTGSTTDTTTDPVDPPASLEDVVDGELEMIADGHQFTEGPVWSLEGHLLYSDIPANTIFKWVEGGASEPFITPSGNSNGLAFDSMGRLLAAEHGNRRISRRVLGEDAQPVADGFEGKQLNSPNDLIIRSDGTIYFTDPPYGIQPNQQEQPFNGVFRVDTQGQLSLVSDDFERPNGIVLSPDETTLYVADTAKEHVRSFAVAPDGVATGGDVFADLTSDLVGGPDGMAVDVFGDIFVTGGGGVRVVTPAGDLLGTIMVPEQATNCTFGDPDGMSLFITAQARVYRIRLKVKGLGLP